MIATSSCIDVCIHTTQTLHFCCKLFKHKVSICRIHGGGALVGRQLDNAIEAARMIHLVVVLPSSDVAKLAPRLPVYDWI